MTIDKDVDTVEDKDVSDMQSFKHSILHDVVRCGVVWCVVWCDGVCGEVWCGVV